MATYELKQFEDALNELNVLEEADVRLRRRGSNAALSCGRFLQEAMTEHWIRMKIRAAELIHEEIAEARKKELASLERSIAIKQADIENIKAWKPTIKEAEREADIPF